MTNKDKIYVEETLSKYKEVPLEDFPRHLQGYTILHIYEVGRTEVRGNLYGYIDARFVDVHIYNVEQKIKTVVHERDQVEFKTLDTSIRIFRDGSTMVIVHGKLRFDVNQSMTFYGEHDRWFK